MLPYLPMYVDDEAKQSNNEQVRGAANDYRLTIMNKVYDCPRIHFVTGITEKIDDDKTVISWSL